MKNIILLIVTFGLPIFLIFGSDTLDDGIKLALWASYILFCIVMFVRSIIIQKKSRSNNKIQMSDDNAIDQSDSDDKEISLANSKEIILTEEEIEKFIMQEYGNRTKEIEGKPKDEYEQIDDLFAEAARFVAKDTRFTSASICIQVNLSVDYIRAAQIVEQLDKAGIIYNGKILFSDEKYLEERITKVLTKGLSIDNDDFSYWKYYETNEQSAKRTFFNEHILPSKEEYLEKKVNEWIEILEIMKEKDLKENLKQELLEEERKKEKRKTEKETPQRATEIRNERRGDFII